MCTGRLTSYSLLCESDGLCADGVLLDSYDSFYNLRADTLTGEDL